MKEEKEAEKIPHSLPSLCSSRSLRMERTQREDVTFFKLEKWFGSWDWKGPSRYTLVKFLPCKDRKNILKVRRTNTSLPVKRFNSNWLRLPSAMLDFERQWGEEFHIWREMIWTSKYIPARWNVKIFSDPGKDSERMSFKYFSRRVIYSYTKAKQKQSPRKRDMWDPRPQSRRISHDKDSCFTCLDSGESKLEQGIRRLRGNSLQEHSG